MRVTLLFWLATTITILAAPEAVSFPKGTIYFTKKSGSKCINLYSIASDGSNMKQLTKLDDWTECTQIDTNAKASHVVFTYKEKMSNGLATVDLKSGKLNILVKPSFKEVTTGCSLSPDGKKIAYAGGEGFENDLFVLNVNGSGKKKISKLAGMKSLPVWSPSGKLILYELRPPEKLSGGGASYNHPDVVAVSASGKKEVNLTKDPGNSLNGRFSPDSKTIVYEHVGIKSKENNVTLLGKPSIWMIKINGKGKKKLSDTDAGDMEPQWSPDGKKVAFISTRASYTNVFVMDADGKNVKQLTPLNYSKKMMPRWSKDGKFIFYIEEKSWKRKGFVVSVETGEIKELLMDCQEFVFVEK